MDDIRLDIITKHIKEMDSGLVDMIERFLSYTKNEKPRIAVICSDNRLRIEMEQIFTVRTDIDAVVCSADFDDDNIYDIMLTDAAVAVTNALQIAPKGLYDTLKRISEVSKEIYVLLGGWGSLPKTPEILASKSQKVPDEFPFAKVVSVNSFYDKKLEGFFIVQEVVDKCAGHILSSFERQHSAQNEVLYARLKKSIANFYDDCNKQIDKETLMAMDFSRRLASKQGRFELEFTHAAVSMQNLVERVSKRMGSITITEVEDACGDLDGMARGDIHSAQRSAKRALAQLLLKALDSCLGDADSPVRIKARATADDCISEMEIINAEVQNATYVSVELKENFSKEVGNTDDLDKIVNKYDEIARLTLGRARERIPAVVKSYRYTLKPDIITKTGDVGIDLLKKLKDRTDAKEEKLSVDYNNSEDFDEKEKRAQAEVNCFFTDTENMINVSVAGVSEVIYECGREVAAEINEYSAQMIKGYFSRITAILEHIGKYLEALHDSYILE